MFGALYGRVVLVLTLAVLSVSAMSGTALAIPDCNSLRPALGATVSCDYLGGGSATINIPTGTVGIDVSVRGGGGGAGGTDAQNGYAGGPGAQVLALLSPSTLTSLTIVVGSGGGPHTSLRGGGGGGFSAIYAGEGTSFANVLAVAGGGGGGGGGTRICAPATGGGGGLGTNGIGGSGDGGDFPGGGGGASFGTGGSFQAVPVGSGTSGSNGDHWSAGGGGGTGGANYGGEGGAGYGGGAGGGTANNSSTSGDCAAAPADGSGGGAGGSYVKPAHMMDTPRYDNSGGAAGGLSDNAGAPGTVTLTFVGATYTVAYDANGGADRVTGTSPVDISSPYVSGSNVTVLGNTGALTRDGFSFDSWNTARNGSGTSYASGNEFVIGADTVLYAQWKVRPSADNTVQNTPVATPTLRTTKPKTTATGVTVTFTAPGPGTATASGTASQGTRAGVTVCRGTTKVLKAGKAVVTCKLNATGRRLRAKGTLTVVLTTTFVAKAGSRLQAAHTVVLPRRG